MEYFYYYAIYLLKGSENFKFYYNYSNIHNIGIFAGQNIPKGKILYKYDEINKKVFKKNFFKKFQNLEYLNNKKIFDIARINDKDFIYPENFDVKTLIKTFRSYLKNNFNNTKIVINPVDQKSYFMISNKLIKKNTEITKSYGLVKWAYILCMDIYKQNIFNIKTFDKNYVGNEWDKKNFNNLKQALDKFGLKITFDHKIN